MDMRFLMKQAQQMQAKLAETQASLRVEGTAGGELAGVPSPLRAVNHHQVGEGLE